MVFVGPVAGVKGKRLDIWANERNSGRNRDLIWTCDVVAPPDRDVLFKAQAYRFSEVVHVNRGEDPSPVAQHRYNGEFLDELEHSGENPAPFRAVHDAGKECGDTQARVREDRVGRALCAGVLASMLDLHRLRADVYDSRAACRAACLHQPFRAADIHFGGSTSHRSWRRPNAPQRRRAPLLWLASEHLSCPRIRVASSDVEKGAGSGLRNIALTSAPRCSSRWTTTLPINPPAPVTRMRSRFMAKSSLSERLESCATANVRVYITQA